MGDSRGRWENDSLVVDVTLFTNQTWFDRAGNFHSEDLHVIERYTPTGPDHLLYEVTIEDPEGLHTAVENADATVSPAGTGQSAPRIRVLCLRAGRNRCDLEITARASW